MKKGLPRHLLLTDPYNSLEGRVLILKTDYPRYIFELNRLDDESTAKLLVQGVEYSIVVRKNIDSVEHRPSFFGEAVRWYHFSKTASNGLKTSI